MARTQLFAGVLLVAAVAAGCNRTETRQEARETAADVKAAASRAGEKIADGWLTTKVQAQYFADDDIKSRYINVTSRDGVVTLKGFVESEDVRQQALQIAKNTDGVKEISDQLLIGRPPAGGFETVPVATGGAEFVEVTPETGVGGTPAMTDEMVASRIQAKYFLDSTVKGRDIEVAAANGVVTLRGQVASDTERAQALLLARTTPGVQRVEDGLTVDASIAAAPLPTRSTPSTGGLSGTPGTVGTAGAPAPAAGTPAPAVAGTPAAAAPPAPQATDAALTANTTLEATLKQKLAADAQLKAAKMNISARDGVVLVEGTAPTAAVKEKVLSAVRGTNGVLQVVDRITVAK
jgi:hyperosmotically inducible periplasmic protein